MAQPLDLGGGSPLELSDPGSFVLLLAQIPTYANMYTCTHATVERRCHTVPATSFSCQAGWLAHDYIHGVDSFADRMRFMGPLCAGMSPLWWSDKHNKPLACKLWKNGKPKLARKNQIGSKFDPRLILKHLKPKTVRKVSEGPLKPEAPRHDERNRRWWGHRHRPCALRARARSKEWFVAQVGLGVERWTNEFPEATLWGWVTTLIVIVGFEKSSFELDTFLSFSPLQLKWNSWNLVILLSLFAHARAAVQSRGPGASSISQFPYRFRCCDLAHSLQSQHVTGETCRWGPGTTWCVTYFVRFKQNIFVDVFGVWTVWARKDFLISVTSGH